MKRKYTKRAKTYTEEEVDGIVKNAIHSERVAEQVARELEAENKVNAERRAKQEAEMVEKLNARMVEIQKGLAAKEYAKTEEQMVSRLIDLQERIYLALVTGNPGLYQNTNLAKIAFNKACDLCHVAVTEQESEEWKDKTGFPSLADDTPECEGGSCDCK